MTISDQIIQVLDALCEKFGFAVDWTSENVIPYLTPLATKLVAYEIWTSVAWLVILLLGLSAAVMAIKKYRSIIFQDDIGYVIIGVFGLVGGTFASSGVIQQIMDIIKCLTFPEMFIFEYIQGVINAAH